MPYKLPDQGYEIIKDQPHNPAEGQMRGWVERNQDKQITSLQIVENDKHFEGGREYHIIWMER